MARSVLYGSLFLAGLCVAPGGPVYSQTPGTIEVRLQSALGAARGSAIEGVSRNYSGLFPGTTFYRASVSAGVHVARRTATVAVTDADTMIVVSLEDVAHAWLVIGGEALIENYWAAPDSLSEFAAVLELGQSIFELLRVTGIGAVTQGSRMVVDSADVAYVQIRWPEREHVLPLVFSAAQDRLELVFIVDSPGSLSRVQALLGDDGGLLLSETMLASNH